MNFLNMGLLTPLYAVGILTITAPLIFHLIRRTPRGETQFSSLMFLSPSPPTLTRRSRLDNILLLLLRALALILISFAFARPFQRQESQASIEGASGKRTLLLVDRSASMRRAGVWQKAKDEAAKVLDAAKEQDQFALMVFDDAVEPMVTFDDAKVLKPALQRQAVRKALEEVTPTWQRTNLDDALIFSADVLDGLTHGKEEDVEAELQIVLISDMQKGAAIESLQGYDWPKSVSLEVRTIEPDDTSNAGISMLATREEELHKIQRVRVTNATGSDVEQFEVGWTLADGSASSATVPAYVPPGHSKVYRLPDRDDGSATRVELTGDDTSFDNVAYVAPVEQKEVRVLFVGDDDPGDAGGAVYYLERAFLESPHYRISVSNVKPADDWPDLMAEKIVFVVVGSAIPDERRDLLGRYIRAGGVVLYLAGDEKQREDVRQLSGDQNIEIKPVDVKDYRLLGELNYGFAPFAELRRLQFADFTKVNIWRYRKIEGATEKAIIARLDNKDPVMFHYKVEKGQFIVWSVSWRPDDSQLSLSKKFPALFTLMLEEFADVREPIAQHFVGDTVEVKPGVTVRGPDGKELLIGNENPNFTPEMPGLFRVEGPSPRMIAVNLQPKESETDPIDVDMLQRRGVRMGKRESEEDEETRERQKRDKELEKSQKLWRYLILATVLVLVIETGIAGRLTRRQSHEEQPN